MCNILFFLYLQCNTVPTQLMSYLDEQAIMEVALVLSTESALLGVLNDIFMATDSGDSVLLVLLDLTAAFDTVNHELLIEGWVIFRVSTRGV